MTKKNIMIAILAGVLLIYTPVNAMAEQISEDTMVEDITPRASRIISGSSYSLDKSKCLFSLSFLTVCSGSGTVTIQKKMSNGSWSNVNSLAITFTNSISMSDAMYNLALYSGAHRIEYKLTVGSISETIYSSEKNL